MALGDLLASRLPVSAGEYVWNTGYSHLSHMAQKIVSVAQA